MKNKLLGIVLMIVVCKTAYADKTNTGIDINGLISESTNARQEVEKQYRKMQEAFEAYQGGRLAIPSMPNLESLPRPEITLNFNDEIASTIEEINGHKRTQHHEHLYVFVSFSMPDASLASLAAEANKSGATLVLNGFVENSLTKTSMAIREKMGLTDQSTAAVVVNPKYYEKYAIASVPSFVLVYRNENHVQQMGCGNGDVCETREKYTKITGNISIRYALEKIAQRSEVTSEVARKFLSRFNY